jgi:hypothetical protein
VNIKKDILNGNRTAPRGGGVEEHLNLAACFS